MGKKSLDDVARDVINGAYGNGQDRVNALTGAGYNAGDVQNIVNQMVAGTYNAGSGTAKDQSIRSFNDAPSASYASKGSYGSYQYGKTPAYTSKYQDQIDKVRDQIANYGPYASKYQEGIDKYTQKIMNDTYDPENDPLYMAYKNQYIRGGQKAMQDTMAKAVALSGGFDNSYANSVAQQQYNDYMAGLADKIPELAQLAQNMYTTKLNTLQGLDATDYSRWGDDRNNLYNLMDTYRNLEGDYYSKWQDEYNNYLKAYDQNQALLAEAAAQAAARSGGGGGGGRGSGGSGQSSGNGSNLNIVQDAVDAINYGSPISAETRIAALRSKAAKENVKENLRKISQYRREGNLR